MGDQPLGRLALLVAVDPAQTLVADAELVRDLV